MKQNRPTDSELKAKGKIEQFEFPFDEQAWISMNALLRQKDRPDPLAAIAEPISDNPGVPGVSKIHKRLIFLVLAVMLGGGLWLFSPFMLQRVVPLPVIQNNNAEPADVLQPKLRSEPSAAALKNRATSSEDQKSDIPKRTDMLPQTDGTPFPGVEPGKSGTKNPYPNASGFVSRNGDRAIFDSDRAIGTQKSEETDNANSYPMAGAEPGNGESGDENAAAALDSGLQRLRPAPMLSTRQAVLLDTTGQNGALATVGPRVRVPGTRFHYGFIFGGNVSFFSGRRKELGLRPVVGLMARWKSSDNISLQSEAVLRFIRVHEVQALYGGQIFDPNGNVIGQWNYQRHLRTIKFLETSLLARRDMQVGTLSGVFGGLRLSWNIPEIHESEPSVDPLPVPSPKEAAYRAGIRSFDMGLTAGAEFRLGARLRLDVRYNQGLRDMTFGFFNNNARNLNSDAQCSLRWLF